MTECSPQAQIIFDRFHVQRLVQDAVDEARRDEARAARSDAERKQLKRTRWPLLKSFWNLSLFDSVRLSSLQRQNKRLYRAYLLKEAIVGVLDCTHEGLARIKLDEWVRWARRSRLEPFIRVAGTIRDHADGILAYVRSGLSNGRTHAKPVALDVLALVALAIPTAAFWTALVLGPIVGVIALFGALV